MEFEQEFEKWFKDWAKRNGGFPCGGELIAKSTAHDGWCASRADIAKEKEEFGLSVADSLDSLCKQRIEAAKKEAYQDVHDNVTAAEMLDDGRISLTFRQDYLKKIGQWPFKMP